MSYSFPIENGLKQGDALLPLLFNLERIPHKALQYRPQGKSDLGRSYRRWKESLCSCRTGIGYPKLRMEEEEENLIYPL